MANPAPQTAPARVLVVVQVLAALHVLVVVAERVLVTALAAVVGRLVPQTVYRAVAAAVRVAHALLVARVVLAGVLGLLRVKLRITPTCSQVKAVRTMTVVTRSMQTL
ncbi:hypothetical protein SPFM20_00111 [Salmonella phage SPFM20]|nr:hypothetical protein SPFM20_00111 [Salmonella phage SPFM20]